VVAACSGSAVESKQFCIVNQGRHENHVAPQLIIPGTMLLFREHFVNTVSFELRNVCPRQWREGLNIGHAIDATGPHWCAHWETLTCSLAPH
jgi:hypothetical protein